MEKDMLKLRKKIKSRKPNFLRQDSHKQKEVKKNWRKPKGIQSKMRLHKKGYRKSVAIGYGSPRKVYGLHSSGLKQTLIDSVKELDKINKEVEGIIISRTVGLKKKIVIVKKAKEKGIKILNIKNPDNFIKQTEERFAKKKEVKKVKQEEKAKKKKETEEKAKEKEEKLAEKVSEEEKKEQDKKEQDKVLTKREN